MTTMTKRRTVTLTVMYLAASLVGGVLWLKRDDKRELPWAAMAITTFDANHTRPVGDDELTWNPKRLAAGLRQIQTGWQIAPAKFVIEDGPQLEIVLDEHHLPVKAISRMPLNSSESMIEEYDVQAGQLDGPAATWWGEPARLWQRTSYRGNRRHGVTIEYDAVGRELARLEYHQGKPWTGRVLQRHGFATPLWDVSYREGKLDGVELQLESGGTTNRLRCFRMGVQHGPDLQYDEGVLRSAFEYAEGKVVGHRSWHPNGRLEWLDPMDEQGRLHGCRQQWDALGQLVLEENYRHGGKHGRQWERGHQEVWFWENRFLGGDSFGETEFHRRQK